MKKDVLISIAGLHYGAFEEKGESEPIEVITPASYYLKNGKHYIIYDEVVEGIPGTVKNTVKITGDTLFEISKSGLANTRMVFEKDKINMTNYQTPFGDMLVGIHTKEMKVDVQEDQIDVNISYVLDVNNEPLSDCQIKVNVRSVK
ncbi:MAG: DUF1934 domain-containing protein [Eubacteriales bacterium]|nr:DUF1934 domain-containing protein [Eubacteriales bacterium]